MHMVLYGRPGCHLCEDAEAWIEELAAELDATLVQANILADPALYEQYKWSIPVLVVGEQAWSAPLDPEAISQALRAERLPR